MKAHVLFVLLLLILSVCVVGQNSPMMVRCDSGNSSTFLSSPSQMNLASLQQSFQSNLDTVIFVHGYLTSYSGAKKNYTKAINIMRPVIGRKNFVGFHWPGKVLWFGTAVANSNKAGIFLMYLVSKINQWYGGNGHRIHLVVHSLGARTMLTALHQNTARYIPWGKCQVLAGAVHYDAYKTPFTGVNQLPLRSYVYHSSRDGVLKYLYSLYYSLFGSSKSRNLAGMNSWSKLTISEQISYLRKLEQSIESGKKNYSELDAYLYQNIQRAKKKAMGLVGSQPVSKVININVTDVAGSHFYWDNDAVLRRISKQM